MIKLFHYVRKYIWAYVIILIMLIINVILETYTPQLTKSIVNNVLIDHKIYLLKNILLGFLIIGLGRGLATYIREVLSDWSASGIGSAIRKDLFHHTQTLSASYFDKNNAGETMSRIKSDADKIWDSMFIITLAIETTFHIGMVLYFMFSMNYKIAILPSILMILACIVAIILERKLDNVYDQIDEEDSVLNDTASENIAGIRTVKAFTREAYEIQKFKIHNKKYYELNVNESKILAKYWPVFQFISLMIPVIILIHGGFYVIKGNMSLGDLTAYIQYATIMTWPLDMVGWIVNGIAYGLASWKRIKKLYSEESDILEQKNSIILNEVKGKISFENVGFEHNGKQILKDVSFEIESGQTLGIMGSTGSGKTTIVNLLTRIYDATKGVIKLDDTDIKNLTTKQLRSSIAPVTQDIFLFSNSVKENISFGKKNSTTEEIIKDSLKKSEASFVYKLPQKEETIIGERGVGLSGGQKQRLTIARALAKKTPVIIFDDSTSALDMETEQSLQKTINELTDVTKIIIAHRISSVSKADKIIILEDGSIAEYGTHKELLALKGLYYQTWISQYGDIKDGC